MFVCGKLGVDWVLSAETVLEKDSPLLNDMFGGSALGACGSVLAGVSLRGLLLAEWGGERVIVCVRAPKRTTRDSGNVGQTRVQLRRRRGHGLILLRHSPAQEGPPHDGHSFWD